MSDVPSLILNGIRAFSASRPRTLQKEVGPSSLGNPCDHCLTAALVGWEKQNDEAWLPLIGTAMHEYLLSNTGAYRFDGKLEWLREHRVTVGTIAGTEVSGNADLFHIASGTVVDLKLVGLSTLNEARRRGASQTYKVQTQLYARGFATQGYDVTGTLIAYLPRNSMRLSDAVFVQAPYDESVALAALERAEGLLAAARTFERVSVAARDVYIDALPRAAGCYDCARYPSIMPRGLSELHEFATNQADGDQ